MGKIAFVFAGQGDQFPGMGKDLYENDPAARAVFDACEALRPGTCRQCFSGTEEELKQTDITQPCLFALELAQTQALMARGICPEAAAGFSLGEVTAAVVSGRLDPETGFRLVCRRGQLMQASAQAVDTAMAAVVKMPAQQLEQLCREFDQVYPVNYNCPGQITVAGLSRSMPAFAAAVKEAGGRAIPLKVSGGFHSPFMAPAAQAFARELAEVSFRPGKIPLYSNVTAQAYGDDPAGLLARQIASPVRWEQIIRNLLAQGFDTFVEIGPGSTLSNMIRKIDTNAAVKTGAALCQEVTPC